MRQVVRVVSVALLGVGMTAAPALAAWSGTSAGPGRAKATTLAAPTGVSAAAVSPTTSAIDIAFTPATNPPGTTYAVTRNKTKAGVLGAQLACTGLTASPCHDTGLASSTTYTYTVTAVLRSWSQAALTATASTSSPTASTPSITSPASSSPRDLTHVAPATTTFTITGTNFVTGAVVTTSDTKYVVTASTVTSAATISVTIRNEYTNNGTNAAALTVTNPDGGSATCTGCIRNANS